MILKVKCLKCGEEGKVLIIFKYIISFKWWYFGTLFSEDYWECRKCRKNEANNNRCKE